MNHECGREESLAHLGGSRDTCRTGSVSGSPDTRGTRSRGWSTDSRRIRSGAGHVNPLNRKWPVRCHLGSRWAPSRSEVNEPNGDHLCRSRQTTCVAGWVTCPPGAGHVTTTQHELGLGYKTPAEPGVCTGHMTPTKPELRDGSCGSRQPGSGVRLCDPDKPEVGPLVPSWV